MLPCDKYLIVLCTLSYYASPSVLEFMQGLTHNMPAYVYKDRLHLSVIPLRSIAHTHYTFKRLERFIGLFVSHYGYDPQVGPRGKCHGRLLDYCDPSLSSTPFFFFRLLDFSIVQPEHNIQFQRCRAIVTDIADYARAHSDALSRWTGSGICL